MAVLVVAGALGFLLLRGCLTDTPEGHRADSTLAEVPHWEDTVRAQNAHIAEQNALIATLDADRERWKAVAHARLRAADTAQAAVDSTVAAGVPAGMDPGTFWKGAYEAQKRVAATLRLQTVPALLAAIAADSEAIRLRDIKADSLERQRDEARRRVARVTGDLTALRDATRPGFKVLGLRVPGWVDNAASAAAGLAVGYAVGN